MQSLNYAIKTGPTLRLCVLILVDVHNRESQAKCCLFTYQCGVCTAGRDTILTIFYVRGAGEPYDAGHYPNDRESYSSGETDDEG